MAAALPLLATTPGGDGPFTTTHWSNGQFAQQNSGPIGLFPNPASGEVNLIFPGLTGEATVSIVAEDGRLMSSFEVAETSDAQTVIGLSDLRNGIYFVRVYQPSGLDLTKQLVVANQ